MIKINMNLIKQSLKYIGFEGTLIRAIGFFCSQFEEDKLVWRTLKKRIGKNLSTSLKKYKYDTESYNDVIWIAWFQGYDKMPDLVKKCYKSVLRHSQKKRVILVTFDNYQKYVCIPDYIIQKLKDGCIELPNFSDILRTALLYQNGGIWIDSTMFLTEDIPKYIWDSDIFFFKNFNRKAMQICSSQFIRAKAGDEILCKTLNMIYMYFKKYSKVVSYYQWHYIFSIVVQSDACYKQIFNKIPDYYSENNHILQTHFFDEYVDEYWKSIKKYSFVHKLSYKHLDHERKNEAMTFYRYFMEDKLA